ncbi:MAG TPA: helix-turn-helix transcriptional regulator [Thermoanaerobaculia bacterium]
MHTLKFAAFHKKVDKYVARCFANSQCPRADESAALFGLSPSRFSNLFLAHFGERPGAYLKRKQIERAKHLLRTTTDNMETIAKASGYRDRETFSRAFKRTTGVTPKQFRESAAE